MESALQGLSFRALKLSVFEFVQKKSFFRPKIGILNINLRLILLEFLFQLYIFRISITGAKFYGFETNNIFIFEKRIICTISLLKADFE